MNQYLSRYLFYYPATYLKGERIYRYLKSYRKFQYLSPEAIHQYQLDKAKAIFDWAKQNSPFYSEHFASIAPSDIQSLGDFAKLPCISKQDLIENADRMLTPLNERFEYKTTGGSTGEPVRIAKNTSALARERAATWRAYEWAGVTVGSPQGRFWGVPHDQNARAKAVLADIIANRKRVSAFDITPESLLDYYMALKKFQPAYLYGYVSAIETLALFIQQNQMAPLPSVKAIITTSEVLHPHSRKTIEEAFKVKVFNEYGCGEVGSIAHECSQGQLHLMADNMLVNIVEQELVVTDFFNYKMPLINYRTGDFGEITDTPCGCGRSLPVLKNIVGRAYDIVHLKSGRAIHPEALIYVFEDFKSEHDVVSQFQIVQQSVDEISLYVVPKSGWQDSYSDRLIADMKDRIDPDVEYKLTVCDKIEREKSGKMRVVKSLVNA